MALFFAEDDYPSGGRKTGFNRYREVLEQNFGSYILAGLLTLAGFLPFALGMIYAVLSTSVLVMLIAALVGGLFAGPALYGLYDLIFRTLRDAPSKWWGNYKKAMKENWKAALLPGVVLCLFLGVVIFAALLMFWWAEVFPGWGTIVISLLSVLLGTMLLTTYWPQLVLFRQSGIVRLKNCLLFCMKYFWHTLGVAALQVAFWLLMALLLPWSVLVLPLIGMWFILFLGNFLLYHDLDTAFQLEKTLREQMPEQAPLYEEEEPEEDDDV
ncbi:MAG: hypothetical protein LUF28_00915 [Clostridiales bacterium]|nr:hypothetical protein [Clostridiales bacterium]